MRFNTMQQLISDVRKNTSLEMNENENKFVYVEKELFNKISNVLSEKSK